MVSYLVSHTKKKRILARKEAALQRLVQSAAHRDKLIEAAEAVRDARVRVLLVQRSIIVPKDEAQDMYAKLDAKIQALSDTPISEILAEFNTN